MLPVSGSHGLFVAFMEETAKIDFSDLQQRFKKVTQPAFWRLARVRRKFGAAKGGGELRTAAVTAVRSATARRAALSAEMGRLCRPRAFQWRRVARANGPRDPKRKTHLQRVFLFGGAKETLYKQAPDEPLRFVWRSFGGGGES